MGMALGGGRGRGARAVDNELRMHALRQSITSAHDIATHAGKSDVDTAALKERGDILQQQSMDFHKNSIDDKMGHWSKMYEEARNLPEGHPEKEARLKALSNIDQFVHAPGGFSVSGLGSVDSGKPSLSYNVGRKADEPIILSGSPYVGATSTTGTGAHPPTGGTGPIPPTPPTPPTPPAPPTGDSDPGAGPTPPTPPTGGGKGPIPVIPPVPPKPPTGGLDPDLKAKMDVVMRGVHEDIAKMDSHEESMAQAKDVSDWERTRRGTDFAELSKDKGLTDGEGTKIDLNAARTREGIRFSSTPETDPRVKSIHDTQEIPVIKPGSPPPSGEVPDRATRRRRLWERD
jgi:hypothetical protein